MRPRMYRRLGFTQLTDKFWVEEIGNSIIPLMGTTEQFVEWAFAGLQETPLSAFQDSFERMVFRAGETVFLEGDAGEHAYIVDSGEIRISRSHHSGETLTLTHLKRGDLFGELALIDWQPRSASAVAVSDSELMTLDRTTFQAQWRANPEHCQHLFRVFSARMRAMDNLAMVLAFAPTAERPSSRSMSPANKPHRTVPTRAVHLPRRAQGVSRCWQQWNSTTPWRFCKVPRRRERWNSRSATLRSIECVAQHASFTVLDRNSLKSIRYVIGATDTGQTHWISPSDLPQCDDIARHPLYSAVPGMESFLEFRNNPLTSMKVA